MSVSGTLVQTFWLLLGTLVFPVAIVLGLTHINRYSKKMLVASLGPSAQIYLGGLGVIIHESSHLLTALLFAHHIESFKLLVMSWNLDKSSSLGVVNHSWNPKSIYQSLGNTWIAIAPILGCTLALIALTRFLLPTFYANSLNLSQTLSTTALNQNNNQIGFLFFNYLHSLLPTNISLGNFGMFIIWCLLSFNITVGGFDLSDSDLRGAIGAAGQLYLFLAIVLFILVYLGLSTYVVYWMYRIFIWVCLVMAISFFWTCIAFVLCWIVYNFKPRF